MDEKRNNLPEEIETAVYRCDMEALNSLLPAAASSDASADTLLAALNKGIEKARKLFKDGTYSLPDFLLAIDAYRAGTGFLKSRFPSAGDKAPKVVIGVVEGDVHDMGKNIVAAVLEASGFEVTDLGKNISADVFMENLESKRPEILALSTMMSTTLEVVAEIIRQARKSFPGIVVLVGGAPFDPELAARLGADGYAENVITIPDESRRVLALAAEKRRTAAPGL